MLVRLVTRRADVTRLCVLSTERCRPVSLPTTTAIYFDYIELAITNLLLKNKFILLNYFSGKFKLMLKAIELLYYSTLLGK